MISLALAAGLLLADTPAVQEAVSPAAEVAADPTHLAVPTGAPREDYPFVAWCYGVLSGYLDLHDQVMPEVTRIESTWSRPGANLADDLKVYATQQRQGQKDLERFKAALVAAEKASLQPINAAGAAAVNRGRAVWMAGPQVSKARLAQEWMSWSLPARCPAVAATLEKRSTLLGASLKVNAETEVAPETQAAAPAPTASN
ncbi:hypothetical protein LJR219_000746 [Phenylobacterium sp. LjRoot219]|uniref:hypothetical protein n=1 Tax=Phenylobacterium sp. LjRoot219 TaxID=3342283 RepID=UPI003ED0859E